MKDTTTLSKSDLRREQRVWTSVLVFFVVVQISTIVGYFYFEVRSDALYAEFLPRFEQIESRIVASEMLMDERELLKEHEKEAYEENVRELLPEQAKLFKEVKSQYQEVVYYKKKVSDNGLAGASGVATIFLPFMFMYLRRMEVLSARVEDDPTDTPSV
jgi:hypothetical protein